MKTVKLSFFNPNSVSVDTSKTSFLTDVEFTEESRLLTFKSGDSTEQVILPLAEEDNLVDVTLVDSDLTLVTDSSTIVLSDVKWEDLPTLGVGGTEGVLDADGNFYPLVGSGGITVVEEPESILVDYDNQVSVEVNKIAQAIIYLPTPVVNTTYNLKLLSLSDTEQWFVLPFNSIDDEESIGITLGPNGGVMLPPGTYELNARFSVYACNRFLLNINDGVNEIARSLSEFTQGAANTIGGELWAEVQGHYRCIEPTEVFISGFSSINAMTAGPRFGRTTRPTAAWPTNPRVATLDIFKIDDHVGPIYLQPKITRLLPDATGYETSEYVISASSEFSANHRAWGAFTDTQYTSPWAAASGSEAGQWVQISLKVSSVLANAIMLSNRNDNISSNFYIRACQILYKPDDESEWVVAAESDDLPRHSGDTALIHFSEYLTIKHLRIVLTDTVGLAVRSVQLLDFQQPII